MTKASIKPYPKKKVWKRHLGLGGLKLWWQISLKICLSSLIMGFI